MSEPRAQQEPTMEEILASIRRIISEDGDDGEKASEAALAPEPAKPNFALPSLAEPSFSKPSSPAPLQEDPEEMLDEEDLEFEEEPDDVLVLTDVVTDDDTVVRLADVAAAPSIVSHRAPDPASEIKAMKSALDSLSDGDAQVRQFPGGGLLSPDSAALANAAFLRVGSLITSSPDGSVTLEDLVKDLLKPMLKTWLDEKLPAIVERLVAEEIARVSGRGPF